MPFYECYLFGPKSRTPACTQIECGNDAAALATCRSLLGERPRYVAFELWQFRRLIGREERPAPRHPAISAPARRARLLN